MKIVKMHKGSREAFDDFLAQRLNEVDIDNDMANKYFADMNLPVPVTPTTKISFLAKHKNKLWLLLLLFITSISTYVVNNKRSDNTGTYMANSKHTFKNNIEKDGENITSIQNTLTEEESFKMENKNELTNANRVGAMYKMDTNVAITKEEIKNKNILPKHKNAALSKINNASNNFLDTSIIINKDVQTSFDTKTTSTKSFNPVLKSTTLENKPQKEDSLYIIW